MSPKSNHIRKYMTKNFSYSKLSTKNFRTISLSLKASVLFSSVTVFIGIIFTFTGLGVLIPFLQGGTPVGVFLIPSIFPVIGLLLLFFSLRKRLKYLRIIKTGKFAYGKFVRSEPTNVKINNATVYRYYFSFSDEEGGTYTASGDTHTAGLSDEAKELLVYNPDDPNEAVLIDIFPYSVKKQMLKFIEDEKSENVISAY